jgi:hypothetical protein
MASSYPDEVDTFSTQVALTPVPSAHHNLVHQAVVAIQTELGTNPAGSVADVKTRLAISLAADGDLALADVSTLTISSGVITVTGNRHVVDTQSSAASDDLDTINGGAAGMVVLLRIANDGRNVVLTQIGNILTPTGGRVTLDTTGQGAILWYDSGQSKWICMTTAGFIIETGNHYFAGGIRHQYNAVSTDTTLDSSYYRVNVDASGGAVIITLPTAVGISGQTFIIRKSDSSGNAVTVDGAGSETINGSAGYSLTAHRQTVSISSDGAGWMVD